MPASQVLKGRKLQEVSAALAGLNVRVTHRQGGRRKYRVQGLVEATPATHRFPTDNGGTTSVKEYFETGGGGAFQGFTPKPLNLVHAGTASNPELVLPVDVCESIGGYKSKAPLNLEQAQALLFQAERPADRLRRTMEQAARLQKSKLLQSYGAKVGDGLIKCRGRVLPAPELVYANDKKVTPAADGPGQGSWRAERFEKAARISAWGAVYFNERDSKLVRDFMQELEKALSQCGMRVPSAPTYAAARAPRNRKEATTALQAAIKGREKPDVLVVFVDGKPDQYSFVKQASLQELGIITQCVNIGDKKFVMKGSVSRPYCKNVAMKINTKLGGFNLKIPSVAQPLRALPPIVAGDKRMANTMYIGADVTHPSADNSMAGAVGGGSYAAVVGCMDIGHGQKYCAEVCAQDARVEVIASMEGMMKSLLMRYYKSNNGMKPKRIIFFRDGVSEGQFGEVLMKEVTALRRAYAALETNSEAQPLITFVVLTKRINTRLYLDNGGRIENPPVGTVVDQGICDPGGFDFYLVSHSSRMTVRPVKYSVLLDENKFDADGLQNLCYKMCHLQARCTCSVSLVPPVYYAHLAAFQARALAHQNGNKVDVLESMKGKTYFV